MNSADPTVLAKGMMTASLLLAVFGMIVALGMFGLWLYALVHCIKHRHDKDRLMWVLITLFGGPFGAILYLAMGKPKMQELPNLLHSSTELPSKLSDGEKRPSPFFDHSAVQDERERVRAIEKALWGNRRKP